MQDMEQLTNGNYIFQQDGARSHKSKVILAYLEDRCCNILKPYFWPSISSDLNTWDYAIRGTLEAKIWKYN